MCWGNSSWGFIFCHKKEKGWPKKLLSYWKFVMFSCCLTASSNHSMLTSLFRRGRNTADLLSKTDLIVPKIFNISKVNVYIRVYIHVHVIYIYPSEIRKNCDAWDFMTAQVRLWCFSFEVRFFLEGLNLSHGACFHTEQGFAYFKCSWLWSTRRWVWNKQIKASKSLSNSSLLWLKLCYPKVVGKLQRFITLQNFRL